MSAVDQKTDAILDDDLSLIARWAQAAGQERFVAQEISGGKSGSRVYKVNLGNAKEVVVKFNTTAAELSVARQLGDHLVFGTARTPKGAVDALLPGAIIYEVVQGPTLTELKAAGVDGLARIAAKAIADFSAGFAREVREPLPSRDIIVEKFRNPLGPHGLWLRSQAAQGQEVAQRALGALETNVAGSRILASQNDMHGGNLLLAPDGTVSIIDFGAASMVPENMLVAKLLLQFEREYGSNSSRILASELRHVGFEINAPKVEDAAALVLAWRASSNGTEIDPQALDSLRQSLMDHPSMLDRDTPLTTLTLDLRGFQSTEEQGLASTREKLRQRSIPRSVASSLSIPKI